MLVARRQRLSIVLIFASLLFFSFLFHAQPDSVARAASAAGALDPPRPRRPAGHGRYADSERSLAQPEPTSNLKHKEQIPW